MLHRNLCFIYGKLVLGTIDTAIQMIRFLAPGVFIGLAIPRSLLCMSKSSSIMRCSSGLQPSYATRICKTKLELEMVQATCDSECHFWSCEC
jgi:hypothetical protein